ncbi:hypothetical protein ACIGZJ_28285 [Kitasatospora sp. NPDC052868]|uniref:hypothetical protein n=1 Tax=Kitasatospora sp. NPDC052868 TaxID=3364060 RepID=UPI0037C78FA7
MPISTDDVLTLADLTALTGLDVLDHLEREVAVPVVAGLQAQGDLIVIPQSFLETVTLTPFGYSRWLDVPAAGLELLRSAGGGNPHSLVADPGACRWTDAIHDPTGLALGLIDATAVAYLIHPEHGATGIAPGRYVVRRQRERGTGFGMVLGRSMNRMVCD